MSSTLIGEAPKARAKDSEQPPARSSNAAQSMGSPAGMPVFLQFALAEPLVQAKCAKCEEEEEEETRVAAPAAGPQVQTKCACCGGGACRHDHQEHAQDSQPAGVRGTALDGVAGASEPLPHLDRIQSSFGRHDVSATRTNTGGPAAQANQRMGSLAYTAGDRIAFRRDPDVKLVAHEAAHVVQQRSGAKLPGGVGRPGDEYERQADAVAEAVDRGDSAEPILDRTIPGGPSGSEPVVQHALQVNAYRQFEPPMMPAPAAPGAGPGGAGGKGKAVPAAAGPAQGGPQAGQSAIAQADRGAPPAPAAQPAAPAGGTEAATDGGGAFNPHCYNADIDEPDEDTDDEPPEPEVTKSKEKVHPDLPRPDETDHCPIEAAVNAQAPPAASPAAGQAATQLVAAAGPAAAPASTQAGGAGAQSADAGAGPAAVSDGGGEIQAGAEAAMSAPSPLEDSIAQAEAGRDGAVSSFQDSDAATRALTPRIAALASAVHFLPDASAGADLEQSRAAETRVSDFFKNASERLNQSLTLAADAVPDRFGAAAESIKANIGAAMEQQKAMLAASVGTARTQAFDAAGSARAQVHAGHDATVAAIDEQTDSAILALIAAHEETIGAIHETETASLDDVNAIYSASYDAHVALGPDYADRADARGEDYAAYYQGCKKYNADGTPWKDGFFAGYLTNRRAQAQVNAARETAKGYRKSLIETANDQAAQAMKGRRKDRCGIIATGRRARTSVDDGLTTLIDALEAGREQSIAQAASTRSTMLASISGGLASALAALDLLEHDGRQSLDDTGYLQQLAVEQAAHASATAVQEAVVQAVGNVETALGGVRSGLAENPAPAPEDVDRILAQAGAGLNGGIDTLLASVDASVTGAMARLDEAGSGALAALDSDAQASFDRVTAQSDGFSSQMDSLASGAAAAFGALRNQCTEQARQTAEAGAEGFMQAALGFEQACDTMLVSIDDTLFQSEQRLAEEFQKQIGGLDNTTTGIPKQATEAASKEQPAWKSIVAIILIIAIIIVVALVIGPAVIGAVGAAAATLGASAGVATAVGAIVGGAIVGAVSSGAMTVVQNWASGQRLTKGLGRAMAVGALTGAIGGAIGLGVNAGLNAVIGAGGRLAMSAGAQFAVRAAVNVTSDALLNIGQQMALTGHVDWGEFAQGVAMSLVLHGSRRVQAFQARMTAVGARGVAGGVARLGGAGEPSAAAARASAYAGQMEHHATTAREESRKPLDWTRPAATPETPAAAMLPESIGKPAATPHETAPAAPPHEAAPAKPPAAPETVAAPKPLEPAPARVAEEHPTPAAVHEAEARAARGPVADPEAVRPIGPEPEGATRVGIGDHEMYVRRGPRGVEVGMCSGVCGPLKLKIEEIQTKIRESDPELYQRLEELKTRATDLEQRIDSGEVPRRTEKPGGGLEFESPMIREVQKLAGELRGLVKDEPSLVAHLDMDPDVRAVKGLEGRLGETRRIVADENWEASLGLKKKTDILYVVRLRNPDGTYEVLKVGQTEYKPRATRNRFDLYQLAGRRLRLAGVLDPASHIEIEVTPVKSLPRGQSIESFEAQLRAQAFEPGKMPWDATKIEGINPLLRRGAGTPFEPISKDSPLYGKYEWNERGELVPRGGKSIRLPRSTDAPSRESMIKLLEAAGGSTEKAAEMSKKVLGLSEPLSWSRIRALVAQYKLQHLRAPRGGGS